VTAPELPSEQRVRVNGVERAYFEWRPRCREIHLADHTHFLPMEIPERLAALILAEAREAEA
jgi:hypothetical protein